MRRIPFVALLAGVVLLSAGLLAAAGAVAQERQQDRTLQRDAAQVAAAFNSYFERARSLNLLLAQNPAFRVPADKFNRVIANEALTYLENLYPGAIGESCLIDENGHELARVTEGVVAAAADLSKEEAENAFFAETLDLDEGEVHQAAPYVSPDTGRWVISNSTWIRQDDGARLIVHFEVSLDAFQQHLDSGSDSQHVAVVDRSTGRTILQDNMRLPRTDPPGAFKHFRGARELREARVRPAMLKVHGSRVATSAVARTPGNANDWVVVEWSTRRASFVPPWVGGAGAAVGVALLGFFLLVLRRQQSALQMAARLDHLTGMANRKALEEALDEAVAAAKAPGAPGVAVLMLDLDGFKQINDTLGHEKGDRVLQEIARRLHTNTFEHDIAARVGGDEFAVVVRELREVEDVSSVGHRLREALIRPIDIDGVPRFIGASIGAAVFGQHGRSSEELLRSADAAMYGAKRAREGVRVYHAGTAAGADALGLAAELHIAIETGAVALLFQPEFSLTTGQVVGVEALARWDRAGAQPVPPAEFIPLAELTGLIRPLTQLTFRKALDQANAWQRYGVGVPVSVNLSAQLAADRSLAAEIVDMLRVRGLRGDALVVEITESTVVKDLVTAKEVLEGLRAIGVRVELDDFGSGYGSFKALHELPLDGVKIDRNLVNDPTTGGQRLLAATIEIGRGLGLKVVAEGIEDTHALDLVRHLCADTAQGFHLAAPLDAKAVGRLLLAQSSQLAGKRRRVSSS